MVEHNAAFCLVEKQVEATRLVVSMAVGVGPATTVAVAFWRLYFDDIRAEMTEHRRGIRCRHKVPALENAYALQGTLGHRTSPFTGEYLACAVQSALSPVPGMAARLWRFPA